MKIEGKTILITGACGGIGECLVYEFLNKKAGKIYAADLDIDSLDKLRKKYGDMILPIKLDITNTDDIASCILNCNDVDILVNNAGIEFATSFLDKNSIKTASIEMAVNYFGVHNLCITFWDLLKEKEDTCIVNILSIASFSLILKLGTYCASKTAAHLLTQALRLYSEKTNVKVYAVYPGYVDTKMTENIAVKKTTPQKIAAEICFGIENNVLDIFPDEMSKEMSKKLSVKTHILKEFTD